MIFVLTVLACQEYTIYEPPEVPPAEPPGLPEQGFGDPPNWNDCLEGWHGRYNNLTVDHPDVNPAPDAPIPTDPDALDWWDDLTYDQFEPGLDFGTNWWPVDEGLKEDPSYFAAHWVAWLRAWDDTTLEFTLGSSDDSWVILNNDIIAELPGVHGFDQQTWAVDVDSGQYPITIRYAHRQAGSGFRFRVISGDVSLCYPDFGTGE